MKSIRTILSTAFIAGLAIVIANVASFAASEFVGVWAVKDSKDRPFEITLSADGKATSTQEKAKEGMERGGWRGRDRVDHGLDHEDHQGGRPLHKDGLQEGSAA